MSEREFNARMEDIQRKNRSKERKAKLKFEKLKFRNRIKRRKNKKETSKMLAIYLFIVFNVVLVYAMAAMWIFRDLSSLGLLITDIIGQVLLFGTYCLKAYNGKKQEEIMKFEKEKLFGVPADDDTDSNGEEAVG